MSKHPSNDTKRNLLRRGLAGVLTLALLLSLLPGTLVTAHAASWADPYVETLVEWGVMRGDVGGNMAPDRSITRAEFVTMMNRAYGYTKLGSMPFTDVRVRDWYYEDINIGYNIGYFQGTSPTTAEPNSSLTREQAAVLLARNMALQETVGETLGFSDTRTLSDWSRGLVGAAAENGIISGYEDGSFRPAANITRGEVAAMLVRAIGTPIQEAGDHSLGNVYGNVTVNTSGVKLRDGVIVGNLYLTGGIDLGDILLENITVLGEIIVSGGGESNSSQSSIIMRNVVADNMVVDSIGDQFITIRAEGNTDIPTTTVRTSAYVDDSSLPGYGLSFITLDGENGALYQLAGNIKEVLNKTPGSSLQVVQGTADKVTVDEYATGSSVLVDGDAVVGELDLDVATNVTGTGDIKNLNVGAAGSTVEQLPDKIDIRPGIDADINGGSMNSSQAAESSSDPKLLAGYPAVKNIAPTSATLVFQTNKSGTIYWAVSVVADGSVSEADLLEPPSYGNKIVASGNLRAASANTDYTAAVARLTSGGSYYVTAMLVDGRDQHSPIKVTSFTTPDNTVPAFAAGYPVMSKVTCDEAQVTVMTTKSCLLYYALLPAGAAAPTPNEFKAAAVPGNLGYGSMSVTKNVTIPFPVNSRRLDEKTNYVLYLWLTDHDGAQSARSVTALRFTTPDETPPVVTDIIQTGETASSIRAEYTIDEPANLIWAIVTEAEHLSKKFLQWDDETFNNPNDEEHSILQFDDEASLLAAKVKMQSGTGALQKGEQRTSPLNINNLLTQNTHTSSYVLYYMAHDHATATGNLSTQIKAVRVYTVDEVNPTAKLRFTNPDNTQVDEDPQLTADISIIFSENVRGGTKKGENVFLSLYRDMEKFREEWQKDDPNSTTSQQYQNYESARSKLATALATYITMYSGTPSGAHTEIKRCDDKNSPITDKNTAAGTWIDWRCAVVEPLDDGSVEVRLPGPKVNDDGTYDYSESGVKLDSGTSYYFHLTGIYDLSMANNPLDPSPCDLPFTTSFAKVRLEGGNTWTITAAKDSAGDIDFSDATAFPNKNQNTPTRIDAVFQATPVDNDRVNHSILWDMLIWTNTTMTFTLYSRPIEYDASGAQVDHVWELEGKELSVIVDPNDGNGDGYAFLSLNRIIRKELDPDFDTLWNMQPREYAIHVDRLGTNPAYSTWNDQNVNFRISVVADTEKGLRDLSALSFKDQYDKAIKPEGTVTPIGSPDFYNYATPFTDTSAPGISAQYPSVSLTDEDGDTKATIGVRLTGPGTLYYLIFPLTSLQDSNGTINTTQRKLTEALIDDIDERYDCAVGINKVGDAKAKVEEIPIMYNDPNFTSVADSKKPTTTTANGVSASQGLLASIPIVTDVTTEEYDSGIVAQDSIRYNTGGTTRYINLEELDPNTIYAVCLVTRGVSATYSSNVQIFRFTTKEAIRPTIDINGATSTSVNVNLDRRSELWYRLADNGSEGTRLQQMFYSQVDATNTSNTWVVNSSGAVDTSNAWKKPTPTGSGSDLVYKGDFSNSNYSFSFSEKSIERMTIIDAMATPCYRTNTSGNNYVGSVFDVFASENAKSTFAGIIQGNAIQGESLAMFGHNTYPAGDNSIACTGMKPGVFYTFLTVGKGATGSGFSFRAYYSVRPADNDNPTLEGVSRGGSWTVTADDKLPNTATLTLNFSEGLWAADTGSGSSPSTQTIYAVDNCVGNAHTPIKTGDFFPLGNIIRCDSGIEPVYTAHSANTPRTGIRDITLKLSDFKVDTIYNVSFNTAICDEAKNNINRNLRISIQYVKIQTNPGATVPDPLPDDPNHTKPADPTYRYELRVTPSNTNWGSPIVQ